MDDLPSGTVTFLLTDVEGSTALWEQAPEVMRAALARHDALVRTGVEAHGGTVIKSRGEGDSAFAVFSRASAAVAAAYSIQQALQAEVWSTVRPVRVRMGLYSGEAELRDGDYFGVAVNRCARLRAVASGGQVLMSQSTCHLVGGHLPADVGVRDLGEHRLVGLIHPERIFQLVAPDLPAEFPPLRSLAASRHNLPTQLTRFVGREREMVAVGELLSRQRLVTLVGPGGAGKTRLSLQLAADRAEQFADGVWLVELAPLTDPSLVPQTVALVLGVREEPGRALHEALLAAVGARRMLLVLDNCEHLIGACADLADAVLRACPSLHLLATSREALGIAGEATWIVPSLSLPDPEGPLSVERLTRSEAVGLFVDRARLANPRFEVTAENASALAQICRRLDGIPLAIEMAVARTRALSVEQIASRLDDRFRLLTGGSRASPPRQQTLRALVDWSYDLLSDEERTLFARLAVFAGGWSLEAAESVCSGDEIEPDDVLDVLVRLADKSLIVVEPGAHGAQRYRLLEILSQYGQERLTARGEVETTQERHAAFFLDLAERAEPELYGPRQAAWYQDVQLEHDNLRAALRWYLTRRSGEALRLAVALWWFWHQHHLWTEGRDWLDRVLALPASSESGPARVRALMGAGLMAAFQRDFAAARARLEESVALARTLPANQNLGRAVGFLGIVHMFQGDSATGQELFQESLAVARQCGDAWIQSTMLRLLAMGAVRRQDHALAGSLLDESLATARASGDPWAVAMALNNYGDMTRARGDYQRAGALYEESLAFFREHGVGGAIGSVLHNLGYVNLHRGEYERAEASFAEALAHFRMMADEPGRAECLTGLACVLSVQGHAARAAHLFGAAERAFERLGTSPSPHNQADAERHLASTRAAIGEDAFTAARDEGRAMDLEQAVAYALHPTDPV